MCLLNLLTKGIHVLAIFSGVMGFVFVAVVLLEYFYIPIWMALSFIGW